VLISDYVVDKAAMNSIELGMIFGIGFAVIGLVLGFVVSILLPI